MYLINSKLASSNLCGGHNKSLSCSDYILSSLLPASFPLTYLQTWTYNVSVGVNYLPVDGAFISTPLIFNKGNLVLVSLLDDDVKLLMTNKSRSIDFTYDTQNSRLIKGFYNLTFCFKTLTKRQYNFVSGTFQSLKFMSIGMRSFQSQFIDKYMDVAYVKTSNIYVVLCKRICFFY